jgi:hypothetical protein
MIHVRTTGPDGTPLLVVGLAPDNLKRLKKTPVIIDSTALGEGRTIIVAGTKEEELKQQVQKALADAPPAPNPEQPAPNPKGELEVGVGLTEDGREVVLKFNHDVGFAAFSPELADQIGQSILKYAAEARANAVLVLVPGGKK